MFKYELKLNEWWKPMLFIEEKYADMAEIWWFSKSYINEIVENLEKLKNWKIDDWYYSFGSGESVDITCTWPNHDEFPNEWAINYNW